MIKVEGITKRYGKKEVLNGVTFELNQREVVGIMGPNGAGKTTLLKIISGLLKSDSGTVTRDGYSMCAIIENPAFSLDMTGLANLEYYLDRKLTAEEIDNAPFGCAEFINIATCKYSMGMTKRLALWLMLLKNTDYILLDEPSNSLDAGGIEEMKQQIIKAREKSGILIVSHNFDEIRDVCDRVLIISEHRLVHEVSIRDKNDSLVKDSVYFIRTSGSVSTEMRDKLMADSNEEGIFVHGDDDVVANAVKELVLGGYNVYEVVPKRTELEEMYNKAVRREVK